MAKTTAVAKQPTTKKDVMALDFTHDIGAGMEGTDKESFSIPFLRVIQKTSPEVDEADAKYNSKAKPGMLVNSVTGELFNGKEGITFLPCAFQRRFIRWGERGSDDSGFKGELLPEVVAQMREDGEAEMTDEGLRIDGDKLSDTRSHFGLVETSAGIQQVLFPLTSTQIKKSKQLMSILSAVKVKSGDKLVTPPTWMNKIKVTTCIESNNKGSWYGVSFEHAGFIDDAEIYALGKSFHDAVVGGQARASYETAADGDGKF